MQRHQTRASNSYRPDGYHRSGGYPEDSTPHYPSGTLRRLDGGGLGYPSGAPYQEPRSFPPAGPNRDRNLPPQAGYAVHPGNVNNGTNLTQSVPSRCPNCNASSWKNTTAGQGYYAGEGAGYKNMNPNAYAYSTTQAQQYQSFLQCSNCGYTPATYSQPVAMGPSSSHTRYGPEPNSGSFTGPYPIKDGRDYQRHPQNQRQSSMSIPVGTFNPTGSYPPPMDPYDRRNQANVVNGNTYGGSSMGMSSVNGVTPGTGSHKSAKLVTRRVHFA